MSDPGSYRRRLVFMGIGGLAGVFISLAGFGLTKNNPSAIVQALSLPGRMLSQMAGGAGVSSGVLVFIAFLAGQFLGWALAFGLGLVLVDLLRRSPKRN